MRKPVGKKVRNTFGFPFCQRPWDDITFTVANMVADMAADMEVHMVAEMEVEKVADKVAHKVAHKVADKVADMVSDMFADKVAKKGTQFGKKKKGTQFGDYVGKHDGHPVSDHRNVVSTLCEVSEMLTEWKSESVMADRQTYGRTDRLTGVGARDTCVSNKTN